MSRVQRAYIVDIQIKRIGVVAFGSFGITVAVMIIALTLSIPLGISEQAHEVLFGDWSLAIQLIITAVAFPFLWRHLKVGGVK